MNNPFYVFASHCRSARLAVGSHRTLDQFYHRVLLRSHHRLLYGMAVQPSHLPKIPRRDKAQPEVQDGRQAALQEDGKDGVDVLGLNHVHLPRLISRP